MMSHISATMRRSAMSCLELVCTSVGIRCYNGSQISEVGTTFSDATTASCKENVANIRKVVEVVAASVNEEAVIEKEQPEEDYTWHEAEVIENYYYEGGLVFQKGERLRLRSYHPEQDDTWRWVERCEAPGKGGWVPSQHITEEPLLIVF